MTLTAELIARWEVILRGKASEYEHPARKKGEVVTAPDIDDICNEMRAFLAGVNLMQKSDVVVIRETA